MAERSYRVLVWSIALVGLLVDQGTKYGIFAWLHGVESNTYALFQTEPVRRTFARVPFEPDPLEREKQRGFFLEVAFEPRLDARGNPVPSVNQGALFGFLREHKTAANGLFAIISLLAAAAIVFWASQKETAKDRWLCISLGLILGGTLGNFYDRLIFNGVRDFLHWNYLFDWAVFNLADCCLVCGAFLLLIQAFLHPQHASQPAKQTEQAMSGTTPAA